MNLLDESIPAATINYPGSGENSEEHQMAVRVGVLWSAHREAKKVYRNTKSELAGIRFELGKTLSALKVRLAVPGRGGLWHSFLRSKRLPRTTADRLIARYEATIGLGNCTNGAVSVSDERQRVVERAIQKLGPLLSNNLNAFCAFVEQLAAACNVEIQKTEHGFFIPVTSQPDATIFVASEA